MTDTNYVLSADPDTEDLPRTVRREKEARAREKRERDGASDAAPEFFGRERDYAAAATEPDDGVPAIVKAVDVPFLKLVTFFLKAVIAAIPALILLTVILWFFGQALQSYFPELVKMKILISFPNG